MTPVTPLISGYHNATVHEAVPLCFHPPERPTTMASTTQADAQRLADILTAITQLGEVIGAPLEAEVGQRFIRVVHAGTNHHVHAFIDRTNGDIIKAATWKAPQKGKNGLAVRGNVLDAADFARILLTADRFGSYLYAR